jgi:hypothetical protein
VEVLAWLAIPVGAVLLALMWVAWVSRVKPPADVHETLEDYQRFKAAFEPRPQGRSRRRMGRNDA